MRDSEVVAAIVAGNPEGLAEAYDRYASPLYTYCRSLLREPADAADAVQDTFVIAASRVAELRDRNRLRPWLYAVARNECHRRLRARTVQVTTPLDEMPDVTDTSADVSGEAERDELRTLLRSAVRGLNSGEQDLIELQLRQGLDAAEIAAMLGVSRNHAHALLSRARDQLEISLGALLVARSGREDCAALNTMLSDWDGQLNVLMRKRINRHIENCPVCAERKKRELAPALLLGLAPLAAAVPPGLREQVLRLASSNTPDAAAHRASVAQRTAPFGHHGFPKPLDPPKSSWWQTRSGQAAAAAAAAAVVAALTLLAVALASSGPGHPGGGAAALGPGAGPGTSIAAADGPGNAAPSGGQSNHPQPTVSANGAANVSSTPGAGGGGGGSAPPSSGSGTSPGSPGHSGHPSPTTSAPTSSSSARPSSPTPSTSSATTASSSPPSRGILTVTPTTIVLGLNGGTLTLKASFGSVNWSIAESSSLIGQVTVSPTAGTLASGQSTTVSLSAGSLLGGLHEAALAGGGGAGACAACTLTVNPGNITVTVVLEISVGNSSSPPPSSPPPDDARPAALVARLVN
jgi:RNA polymerase sigma factor (sigma-70 family)